METPIATNVAWMREGRIDENAVSAIFERILEDGCSEMIPLLQKSDVDLNAEWVIKEDGEFGKTVEKMTFLEAAIKSDKPTVVEGLLKAGVAPEFGSGENHPLHMAVSDSNCPITELLCRYGADVDKCGVLGTPLDIAVAKGDAHIADLLLSNGASVKPCKEESLPLLAAKNADLDMLLLFVKHGIDLNMASGKSYWQEPPLVTASALGDIVAVEMLIKAGCDVTVKTKSLDSTQKCGVDVWTALHVAVLEKHADIIKLLIDSETDINIVDIEGNTPLHIACKGENVDMVKLLLSLGGVSLAEPSQPVKIKPRYHRPKDTPSIDMVNKSKIKNNHAAAKSGSSQQHDNVPARNQIPPDRRGHQGSSEHVYDIPLAVNTTNQQLVIHTALDSMGTDSLTHGNFDDDEEGDDFVAYEPFDPDDEDYVSEAMDIYVNTLINASNNITSTRPMEEEKKVTLMETEDYPEDYLEQHPERTLGNNPERHPKKHPEMHLEPNLAENPEKHHKLNPKQLPEKHPQNDPPVYPKTCHEQNPNQCHEQYQEKHPTLTPAKSPEKSPEQYPKNYPEYTEGREYAVEDIVDCSGQDSLTHLSLDSNYDFVPYEGLDPDQNEIYCENDDDLTTENIQRMLDSGELFGNADDVIGGVNAGKRLSVRESRLKTILLDVKNNNGHTPLLLAVQQGNVEIVNCLVAARAKVNVGSGSMTALHLAAGMPKTDYTMDIVKLLLKNGACINAQDNKGFTPLLKAVWMNNVEVARYLLDAGADSTIPSLEHGTALHVAAQNGNVEITDLLLNQGCEATGLDRNGYTPLMLASRKAGAEEICEKLLDKGAKMNVVDKNGETALSSSIYFGLEKNATVLIQHGADMDIPDHRGTTALYWAIFGNRGHTLSLLLNAGVTMTKKDLMKFPKNLRVMRDPHMSTLLKQQVSQPHSLQQLCRLSTRGQLRSIDPEKSIMGRIEQLGLPKRLKNYLQLTDL